MDEALIKDVGWMLLSQLDYPLKQKALRLPDLAIRALTQARRW